jgi:hypothetical protein
MWNVQGPTATEFCKHGLLIHSSKRKDRIGLKQMCLLPSYIILLLALELDGCILKIDRIGWLRRPTAQMGYGRPGPTAGLFYLRSPSQASDETETAT